MKDNRGREQELFGKLNDFLLTTVGHLFPAGTDLPHEIDISTPRRRVGGQGSIQDGA